MPVDVMIVAYLYRIAVWLERGSTVPDFPGRGRRRKRQRRGNDEVTASELVAKSFQWLNTQAKSRNSVGVCRPPVNDNTCRVFFPGSTAIRHCTAECCPGEPRPLSLYCPAPWSPSPSRDARARSHGCRGSNLPSGHRNRTRRHSLSCRAERSRRFASPAG